MTNAHKTLKVTVEDEYKVVRALSNSVTFNDLEPRPVTVQFIGEYLANGASDPLHVWF